MVDFNPFDDLLGEVVDFLEKRLADLISGINTALSSVAGTLERVIGGLANTMQGAFVFLSTKIALSLDTIVNFNLAFVNRVKVTIDGVNNALQGVVNKTINFVEGGYDALKDAFTSASSAMTFVITRAIQTISNQTTDFADAITGGINSIGAQIAAGMSTAINRASELSLTVAKSIETGLAYYMEEIAPALRNAMIDLAILIWENFISIQISDEQLENIKKTTVETFQGFGA